MHFYTVANKPFRVDYSFEHLYAMLPFTCLAIDALEMKSLNLSGCWNLTDANIRLMLPKLECLDICSVNLSADSFSHCNN